MEIREFKTKEITLEKDYVGFHRVKRSLYEVVDYLRVLVSLSDSGERERLKALISSCGGSIITGDAGVGKTYALHALANEAKKLGYRIVDGSEVYYDEIDEFFRKCEDGAKESPMLIVFDDRRELLGSELVRQTEDFWGSKLGLVDSKERELLGKFKRYLDRLHEFEKPTYVIVTAAVSPSVIDRQISRRLRKIIHIPNPNLRSREELFGYYLNKHGLYAEGLDLLTFSFLTEGLNAAKIAEIVSDVAYKSHAGQRVSNKLVIAEIIKTLRGPSTTDLVESEEERIEKGYHEGGGHLVTSVVIGLQPILVTVEPVVGALGKTIVIPSPQIPRGSSKYYFANVISALGSTAVYEVMGRGGEEGRESDLRDAVKSALKLYSLKDPLPTAKAEDASGEEKWPYLFFLSEEKKRETEKEVGRIMDGARKIASGIIREYKHEIEEFVEGYLVPKGTLAGNEILSVFRRLGIPVGGRNEFYRKLTETLKGWGYLV